MSFYNPGPTGASKRVYRELLDMFFEPIPLANQRASESEFSEPRLGEFRRFGAIRAASEARFGAIETTVEGAEAPARGGETEEAT